MSDTFDFMLVDLCELENIENDTNVAFLQLATLPRTMCTSTLDLARTCEG